MTGEVATGKAMTIRGDAEKRRQKKNLGID